MVPRDRSEAVARDLRHRLPEPVRATARAAFNRIVAMRDPSRATMADLRACYRLLLGRPPDPHGLRTYAPRIRRQGITVDELIRYFVSSPEAKARLRALAMLDGAAALLERVELTDGFSLFVRSDDSSVGAAVRTGEYEPHVAGRLRRLLRPGGVFVDVGASIGFFTVLAGRIVGPEGRVLAFEPGSQNTSVLQLNVELNGLDNVEIWPFAVSARPGVVVYSRSGGNGHVSPFDGDPAALDLNELVRADTLDRLVGDRYVVDAMKVDVEGAEGLVLQGAAGVLARCRPHVFFELTPPSLEVTSRQTGESVLGGLADLGYSFEILSGRAAGGRPAPIPAILAHFESTRASHLDLLAVPTSSREGEEAPLR